MKVFIGIDLGTSGMKALLVSQTGEVIQKANAAYPCDYPLPGWSEQSPSLWWEGLKKCVADLTAGVTDAEIAGIGVAGQMHGLVALDKTGTVIRPAILWNDGRSEKQTAYLNESIGKEKLKSLTGNIAFPGFTAPKLLWMKENEPENYKKIYKILLPKDYLNYLLTGNYCSDLSDASGTLLLDVQNGCWSEELLHMLDISQNVLPDLYHSYECVGKLTESAAKELHLPIGIPVCAGAGDNAAAAIGTLIPEKNRANISLGTSGTVFLPCETFSEIEAEGIHNFRHADGNFHFMACILSAASCNEWFCKDILNATDFALEQQSVTNAHLGNNHVYFLPYLMGERSPMNDVNARGVFFGLRRDTARQDMLLSVLEGVAFAIKQNIEDMTASGISIRRCSVCGGGARSLLWLNILSNVLNLPLDLPTTEEGPSYGAAILAAVGANTFQSVTQATSAFLSIRESISPDPETVKRYQEKYQNFKKLYPALQNLFKEIK